MEETTATTEPQPFRGEDWFDPLEGAVRERIRGFIEEMLEAELDAALQRRRYDRRGPAHGHRHGHRERQLIGTFGPVTVSVPRARLAEADGRTSEWRNRTIPSYKRLTKRAEALVAATYLAGTNTRRVFLDELVARGLGTPELGIVDGAPGLEAALAALWPTVPVQRCTVHKHRNLLAHAPKKLHDEISADYTDMIYAKTVKDVEAKHKTFVRKWRLKCPDVVDSLEEAGARLFTFLRYPPEQWKSLRTTNAVERLHEEFKRRIKTQCLLPCAATACMLFWALLASGQISLRRVDCWDTFHIPPGQQNLELAA